jgi:hypothetical protein
VLNSNEKMQQLEQTLKKISSLLFSSKTDLKLSDS